MKKRTTKPIHYRHEDGSILEGIRVIEGTTKIRQVVVYRGQYKVDSKTYRPGQEGIMVAVAKQLLYEFYSGRLLDAKVYSESVRF